MYLFLVPLVLGFASNSANAFTVAFSHRWGERRGSMVTVILRDVLGMPVWGFGFVLASLTSAPLLFAPSLVTNLLGWLMVAMGGVIILLALVTIRMKAVMPSTRDGLVQKGLYACMCHPIHSGTILEFLGLFLVIPKWPVTVACALGVVWILVQTWLEEMDLLQRLPNYREYMMRVPRFLPRFRTK